MRALPYAVIVLAAAWIGVAGVRWGTRAAGSTDSHGYISQAAMWLEGGPVIRQPIALTMPWEAPDETFAPLGYRPGVEPGTAVPIYPAGLPLVMALFRLIGGADAVFVVAPLLGVVCVLAAAWLAIRIATPGAGAIAALLLAASPTFLYSLMWPMSDVPAAAWWTLALALVTGSGVPSAIAAGAAAALAILTRPNMVIVAVAPALFLAYRWRFGRPSGLAADRSLAFRRLVWFCAIAAIGCFGVAVIHTWWYGSPLRTGYGHVTQVFSAEQTGTIVQGFVRRPVAVEPAIVVLGVIGALTHLRRRGESSRIAWLCLGTMALVLLAHTFYMWFAEWWYLRMLLTAGPPLAALGGAGAVWLARFAPTRLRGPGLAALGVVILAYGLNEAVERRVFQLRAAEARYEAVARFVTRALPPNAAFFAFQQSGGLRYYADRLVLRFDVLLPKWFDTAISKLRARGYRPYFVVEDSDIREFKLRFRPESPLGYLNWPAVAELRGPVNVWIFDPADRGKSLEGQRIVTHQIRP